jgi:hypothetical protein
LKNKEKEEKRYKEKSKDYKKKYQNYAHVGQKWESSNEDSDHEGMATLAIPKSLRKLFNNIFDDEDDTPFFLWQEGLRYKNHPPPPLILPPYLVVHKIILMMRKNNIKHL